ncbi:hypothetical protein DFP93_11036 [Aneurinibacillus soli]|uniref:Uncharacterized protein n=1 Tax=Aneurinibacillus soli TaxID=1500254 RepID=A0A0U5AZG9_9BACL|nr:hypothetical protein [Aneurinibacillus soli]PYE61230.1 hypothetical protein DFP93_11036 [Aneurinibacillus soli]BAU26335.1 hypothetical protein CB4_00449 [Aneurinibacillus soli]
MNDSYTLKWSCNHSHEETFQGRVDRITIYLQSKVLEIIDSNDSVFYLIYFKNNVLGGGSLQSIYEETFLHKAFQQGMTIHASHPLFSAFLPKNHTIHIPEKSDVFTHLQNHLSLTEISLAATYMDNFMEESQLVSVIRRIFNHFKQNGQLAKAYEIAKILLTFSPNIKAMQEMIRIPAFEKYRKADDSPLLMESFYYQNRTELNYERQLHQLLHKQSRHLEQLLLFMNLFEVKHDFDDYNAFTHLLERQLKPEDRYKTLQFLCEHSTTYSPLSQHLVQEMIYLKQYPEALSFLITHFSDLSLDDTTMIEVIIEHVEPSYIVRLPAINQIISSLYRTQPEKKEVLVRRLVTCLLTQSEPPQVKEWIEPIRSTSPRLPVVKDIEQLTSLSQDLDQLTRLGELYYQFGLLDQSIESFTWEMELKPDELGPVRWLSKLYKEKGMNEEANTYKNLSIHMAKRA